MCVCTACEGVGTYVCTACKGVGTYVCTACEGVGTYVCTACEGVGTYVLYAVLEIMVSIQTFSNHFGILSDPKKFGSDIWLSTTSCSFHTNSDVTKSLY